jgi:hypothetical protein
MQEAMLHAAATALHLAADGQITAQRRLASAIQPPRQHVYGDRPRPARIAEQEAVAQTEARIALTRTDRDTARQMLTLAGSRSNAPTCSARASPPPCSPAQLGRTNLL